MLRRLQIVRRSWFQTLIGGLVLFYVVQGVLLDTQNPNFVPTLILLGAFLTPVTLVAYLYERQPLRNVPVGTVGVCFFCGGLVGTIVAGFLEYESLRRLDILSLFAVAAIEEAAKLLFPLGLYVRGRYRLESEGLLFGVAAGMGFAALETMGYGFVALLQARDSLGVLDTTLLVRGLLAPAGHAAWTGLVCAVAWRERRRAGHVVLNGAMLSAFLVAASLHALWDIFNSLDGRSVVVWLGLDLLSLAVAVASLALLIRRIREASRLERPPSDPGRARAQSGASLMLSQGGLR